MYAIQYRVTLHHICYTTLRTYTTYYCCTTLNIYIYTTHYRRLRIESVRHLSIMHFMFILVCQFARLYLSLVCVSSSCQSARLYLSLVCDFYYLTFIVFPCSDKLPRYDKVILYCCVALYKITIVQCYTVLSKTILSILQC